MVFHGELADGTQGVFSGDGRNIITIADTNGPFSDFFDSNSHGASINNSGVVAFQAFLKSGGDGIFIVNEEQITTIADTNGPFGTPQGPAFGQTVSLNEAGVVAFRAILDSGRSGVFLSQGGSITMIADTSGPPSPFDGGPSYVAINNAGTVVFDALLVTGGDGIFTGPDPVADRVIATGDSLLGSTVESVRIWRDAINNHGQIAFGAILANGIIGVFRAEPR